jgi:hydrogenase nickel incorporation protein HypB
MREGGPIDRIEADVHERLWSSGVAAVNIMSPSGAGTSSLLASTRSALGRQMRIEVVPIRDRCDFAARRLLAALDHIDLMAADLLCIATVGQFDAPPSWSTDGIMNVALFSVADGDDRPLRAPHLFERSAAAVITKTDLLMDVDFDLRRAAGHLRDINPYIDIVYTSTRDGTGLEEWYEVLRERVRLTGRRVSAFTH